MRKSLVFLSLLCLCLTVTAFRCGGGGSHQGNDGEWQCDEYGTNCIWVPHHHFRIQSPSEQPTVNDLSDFVGVVNLAPQWQYDSTQKTYVEVTLKNAIGKTRVKSFTLAEASPSVAASIPSLNDNTVPYAFVIANPTILQEFISAGFTDGFQEVDATPRIPVKQVDFYAPSGDYVNRFRAKDSEGVFYDDPFTIKYVAPATQDGSTPGTVEISE